MNDYALLLIVSAIACKEGFPIQVNNIRLYRTLYFFDYTPNSRFNHIFITGSGIIT